MNGPGAYSLAEIALSASDYGWQGVDEHYGPDRIVAALGAIREALVAQAHATLALAAATALAAEGLPRRDDDAWFAVAATQPNEPGEVP